MELKRLKQNIDYNNIVTGKDLDYETYEKKFEMWDYVVDNNLLAQNDPNAVELLKDPTIYFYAFFQDDDGNPWKSTCYQDAIHNCEYDFDPMNPNRYLLFKASNQIGKSADLCLSAIFHSVTFFEENVNVVMVSRSLPQSQFLLAQIRHRLNNSSFAKTWREDVGETANTTILTFQKTIEGRTVVNRIICAPCGEGLLGYPVHYLYMDEADFYDDGKTFFWKVAFPRTNKTKGKIILYSNPDPERSRQSSLLWELWTGDLFKRKFSFNFLDAPWNTKEEFEQVRKSSPGYIFASTHVGEFPPDGGGFFTKNEIDSMLVKDWRNEMPIVDRPIYIGLDLAKVKDNTVLVLGTIHENKDDPKYQDLHVRHMIKFPSKTDYETVIDKLKHIVDYYTQNYYGVARVGFDATGVGKAIEEMIARRGIKATPVIFSLQSKSRMYGNFKMLAEQRRMRIVYNPDCELQLSSLVFKRSAAGHLQVQHEREDIHDDYPDALCCLIDVSVAPSLTPSSVTVARPNAKQSAEVKEAMEKKYSKIWKAMGIIEDY
jgi:hypothetical protein|tara:strand:+ start:2193 stop:3821 length:1629 start_codon:yes stop_codon:yes gene_type:complete